MVKKRRLLNIAMAAQVELSRGMAKSILGNDNAAIRFYPVLSADQNRVVGLDKISATATLRGLAQCAFRSLTEKSNNSFLQRRRTHNAMWP